MAGKNIAINIVVLWIPKGHYIWRIFSLLWFICTCQGIEMKYMYSYIDNWLGTPVIRHVGVLYHISRTVYTRAHSKCSIIRKKSCICGNYQKLFFFKINLFFLWRSLMHLSPYFNNYFFPFLKHYCCCVVPWCLYRKSNLIKRFSHPVLLRRAEKTILDLGNTTMYINLKWIRYTMY